MVKKRKEKKSKSDKKREIKLEHSILISVIMIILSTIFYRFELGERTFYLRYVITFLAIIIGVDTISLMKRNNNNSYKYLSWLKRGLLILAILILLIVIYYITLLMP